MTAKPSIVVSRAVEVEVTVVTLAAHGAPDLSY